MALNAVRLVLVEVAAQQGVRAPVRRLDEPILEFLNLLDLGWGLRLIERAA